MERGKWREKSLGKKAPGQDMTYPVDEEKEGIERFGGNLPVGHNRYDFTKTAGDCKIK